MSTKLYRCYNVNYEGGTVGVSIHGYRVVKTTPKGCFVDLGGLPRWVSNTSKKRFAHPTKAEAIASFKARKRRQIAILTAQLATARKALEKPDSEYVDCAVDLG